MHGLSASTENIVGLEVGVENFIEGGAARGSSREVRDMEMGGIKVSNSVDVDSHSVEDST